VVVPAGRRIVVMRPEKLSPFRLGLGIAPVVSQSGDLASGSRTTGAFGFDFGFSASEYVRHHLGIAHEWETHDGRGRKGFRIDLIALGFPIVVLARQVQIHVEPKLRVARGEILFSTEGDGQTDFRIASGFGLALTLAVRGWFLSFEPLSADFRYFSATKDASRTGFATLWWLETVLGREF